MGTLYKPGDYFGCRHCHQLTYASRKLNYRQLRAVGLSIILVDERIRSLEASMKRERYAGRPTRKYRKILALYRKFGG